MGDEGRAPPTPPPLPPPMKQSSLAMKVKLATPGWYCEDFIVKPPRRGLVPPTGPYFLYGTLQDPMMLVEILYLPSRPTLREAEVTGYKAMLWGQYPALVKHPEATVRGLVFDVASAEHAQKLAAYETYNYSAEPCLIHYRDGRSPEDVTGYTYLFVGNPKDLSEGDFDLSVWLKRMRRSAVEQQI